MTDMDEFLKYQDKLVAGEDVSGYKFSGEVTQMPKQFNEWVKANEKRIKSAKSLPYFIRDNYVGGDISKGLKFQSVAQLTKTNVFTEATSMTEVVERLKRCGIKEIETGDRDVILQHLTMKKLSKEFDFIYSYKRI